MDNKKLFIKYSLITFITLVIIEILSFLSELFPWLSLIVFIGLILATLYFSIKNLAYGFLILLAELLIGSQGYLFSLEVNGFRLSIRIALWIVVMTLWFYQELKYFIQHKRVSFKIKNSPYLRAFGALFLALILSFVIGLLKNNNASIIFIEAKRWFYIIAIIPMTLLLSKEENKKYVWPIITAAISLIAVKTAVLVYIFLHGIYGYDIIYNWLRHDLLGEVTLLKNGFSRVFLQSQIFAIPAFLISVVLFNFKKQKIFGLLAAIFLATIITSLSRSFWLGAAIAWLVTTIALFISLKPKLKQILIIGAQNVLVIVAGFVFLYIAAQFPFPKPLASLDSSLISDRATQFEAAAASRWSLLPVMWKSIKESPILGQGMGKELTYKTSDPRVLQSAPDGMYTTNAFEWGWLDIWLKLGILGLIAYIYLFIIFFKNFCLSLKNKPLINSAALGAACALIIIHIFTPYLNHPLGFGYLALLGLASKGID